MNANLSSKDPTKKFQHKARMARKEAMVSALCEFSRDEVLRSNLALFGGGFLYVIQGSPRSTSDLDFTPIADIRDSPLPDELRERLRKVLQKLDLENVKAKKAGHQNRVKGRIAVEGLIDGVSLSMEFSSKGHTIFAVKTYLIPSVEAMEILGETLFVFVLDKIVANVWRKVERGRAKGLGYKPTDLYDIYFIKNLMGDPTEYDFERIKTEESRDVSDILGAIQMKLANFYELLNRKDIIDVLRSIEPEKEDVVKYLKRTMDPVSFEDLSVDQVMEYWNYLISQLKKKA